MATSSTGLPGKAEMPFTSPNAYAVNFAGVGGEADPQMLHGNAEALRLVGELPDTPFKIKLKALHARLNLIFGREVEAERWARAAVELARALDRPGELADAETTLALLRRRADEPEFD